MGVSYLTSSMTVAYHGYFLAKYLPRHFRPNTEVILRLNTSVKKLEEIYYLCQEIFNFSTLGTEPVIQPCSMDKCTEIGYV